MTQIPTNQFTLGQLAKHVGLARSSVLHYESIGLLVPSGRSTAGYRFYGKPELDRLLSIRRLREAGLALADVHRLLAPSDAAGSPVGNGPMALLETRLLGLCQEVARLRAQQGQLARLLALADFRNDAQAWDKEAWVALLRRAGFDDEAMHQWHLEFEREDAPGHTRFLKSLGLKSAEVTKIRRWSQAAKTA